MEDIKELKIIILAYIDNSNPGWIRCCFTDIHRSLHYFIEKVPVITLLELDENSTYPQDVTILCKVIDINGKKATVDISKPWGIEDENGEAVFAINENRIK